MTVPAPGQPRITGPSRLLRILRSLRLTLALLVAAGGYAAGAAVFSWSFRGPVFVGIAVLFLLNLTACTVHRLLRHPHRRVVDYMADAIHIGLLVLVLGAGGSMLGRREQVLFLSPGDRFVLDDRWELTLEDSYRTADNWFSRFALHDLESSEITDVETRVNRPVRLAGRGIYQTAWEQVPVLRLSSPEGQRFTMAENEGLQRGNETVILERLPATVDEADDAVGDDLDRDEGIGPAESTTRAPAGLALATYRDGQRVARRPVVVGQFIGGLTVVGIDEIPRTVVTVVRDPGAVIALIGAIIMSVALTWYVIDRARREDEG